MIERFASRRSLPLLLQDEVSECGLACLAMISCFHGQHVTLAIMRERFGSSLRGIRLSRLLVLAREIGFDARPLRASVEFLPSATLPCILHWEMNHFVVLKTFKRGWATIYDPAYGRRKVKSSDIAKHYSGILVELAPNHAFPRVKAKRRPFARKFLASHPGTLRGLAKILVLAIAMEVLSLSLPYQARWAVDLALPNADIALLKTIGVIFLAILFLQSVVAIARDRLLTWLGASLNLEWMTKLFAKLMHLPLEYFDKRDMGDVISRFSSITAIQAIVTGTFVVALLDGITAFLSLGILISYSVPMTLVLVSSVTLYGAAKYFSFLTYRRLSEERLVYSGRQQTILMESIRGIAAIKIANKQRDRERLLSEATMQTVLRGMSTQRMDLGFATLGQTLFGAQRLGFVTYGVLLAISSDFSIGMLIAFLVYTDQFVTKSSSLIDKSSELSMLKLHIYRIGDVVNAKDEHDTALDAEHLPAHTPRITVHKVSYRYAPDEPWVLENISFEISPGESLAIVGPSGCGKSTLVKILLGLLTPTGGVIKVDGIPVTAYGLAKYRRLMGAVLQEDFLFAGSIKQNISFFDEKVEDHMVEDAARAANIFNEIREMPMAFETRVGNMGSSLSGGQRQRVLLARALYRKPKVLILDEATSHLDAENEKQVNLAIRNLAMTRIICAHRRETIESADRVISLDRNAQTIGSCQ